MSVQLFPAAAVQARQSETFEPRSGPDAGPNGDQFASDLELRQKPLGVSRHDDPTRQERGDRKPDTINASPSSDEEAVVSDEASDPADEQASPSDGDGAVPSVESTSFDDEAPSGVPHGDEEGGALVPSELPLVLASEKGHQAGSETRAAPAVHAAPGTTETLSNLVNSDQGNGGGQGFTPQFQVGVESNSTPNTAFAETQPGASGPGPVAPSVVTSSTLFIAPTDSGGGPESQSIATSAFDTEDPIDATNLGRVARGMRNAINQHGGLVTLRLHPPDLGFVRIEMQIQDGTVRVEITSEHSQVRSLLTQHLGQLRVALESHGLNVERLVTQSPPSAETLDTTNQHNTSDGRSRGAFSEQDRAADAQDNVNADESDRDESLFEQELNTVA